MLKCILFYSNLLIFKEHLSLFFLQNVNWEIKRKSVLNLKTTNIDGTFHEMLLKQFLISANRKSNQIISVPFY